MNKEDAMIKRLTKHGNSLALVIEKPVLELLKITDKTALEVVTDGEELRVRPVRDSAKRKKLEESIRRADELFGRAFKDLAN
jgi:antitoxin component of MazEF toxin-antitoxin module